MILPAALPGQLPLVRRRFDALRAQGVAAQSRYQTLSDEVGQAKARVESNDSVQEVLIEMQRRGHARSVGVFEQLLTALLRDVFPEERSVHLDLYTERGLSALDFYVSKKEGELEDAETGTGGGVTNALSTGLRFIALARSDRRPFIILDEPDCWMETKRVAAFARLIQQTATELGVQVLMISHHPDSLLTAIPHRLMLEKGPQGLEINWAPSSEIPTWEPGQSGLRGVMFENCFGHSQTFLPLAPGVTLLRGSNDEGKSSLVSALSMVVEGKTKDTMIQHHKPWARVTMDFGPDKVVRFQRKRTGSPKVCYELINPELGPDSKPERTSTDSRARPDWLLDVTGIGAVDDLNVQMGNQKQPVFLLNQTSTQRAKALAIGSESGYIQQMMAFDKQEVQEARLFIRQGEKELERLHRQLLILKPVMTGDRLSELETVASQWPERRRLADTQRDMVEQWHLTRHTLGVLKQLVPRPALKLPPPSPAPAWRTHQTQWHSARSQLQTLSVLRKHAGPVLPRPSSVPGWRLLHGQWVGTQRVLQATAGFRLQASPKPPAPLTSPKLRALGTQWQNIRAQLHLLAPLAQRPPAAPTLAGASLRPLWQQWIRVRQAQDLLMQVVQANRPQIPTLSEKPTQLRALQLAWMDSQTQVETAQRALEQAKEEAQATQAEEAEALKHLRCAEPTCPTCHRAWPDPH